MASGLEISAEIAKYTLYLEKKRKILKTKVASKTFK
jgi:hypothetical protein